VGSLGRFFFFQIFFSNLPTRTMAPAAQTGVPASIRLPPGVGVGGKAFRQNPGDCDRRFAIGFSVPARSNGAVSAEFGGSAIGRYHLFQKRYPV
jgi:hypothetical protein